MLVFKLSMGLGHRFVGVFHISWLWRIVVNGCGSCFMHLLLIAMTLVCMCMGAFYICIGVVYICLLMCFIYLWLCFIGVWIRCICLWVWCIFYGYGLSVLGCRPHFKVVPHCLACCMNVVRLLFCVAYLFMGVVNITEIN